MSQAAISPWLHVEDAYNLATEAAERITSGEDANALVHICYYPDGTVMGLSSGLPPNCNLSGYTSRYYPLRHFGTP